MSAKRARRVLPASPLSIACPYCHAKRGRDCATAKGGFAVMHVARIEAAAAQDAAKKNIAHGETDLPKKVKRLLSESQRLQEISKKLKQQTDKLRQSLEPTLKMKSS